MSDMAVVVVNGSTTAPSRQDHMLLCDAAFGNAPLNIQLPHKTDLMFPFIRSYVIKKIDASEHPVTVTPGAGTQIDGQDVVTLKVQWAVIRVTFNGTNWYVGA